TQGGPIIVREQNSCADLKDTIQVNTLPSPVGGKVSGDTTVCSGNNFQTLVLSNNVGYIMNWIYSTDGSTWNNLPVTTPSYIAQNLTTTTTFKAIVQNGTVCNPDTSSGATVTVDAKSIGGTINPANSNLCENQPIGSLLNLTGKTGNIIDWQSSSDNLNWQNFNPVLHDSSFMVNSIPSTTSYRTIVKNGVCEPDTSSVATVALFNVPFPQASINPADTTICYGTTANLSAVITIGTSYNWIDPGNLTGAGDGRILGMPFPIQVVASPPFTTDYVLSIKNEGCPNSLNDTFHVKVLPQIIVDAGRDTSVVVNQPLQLHASSNDSTANTYEWIPTTGLDNPDISSPIALLNASINSVKYTVKVSNPVGCFGENSITVKVFKTGPEIFVPNAFTPGTGINNIFRPIPVGVSYLEYFRIYNRSGQLVYSTSQIGQGWDGTLNGKPQDSGGYVWMVQGVDYLGNTIFKKGVMVLIR
ncbi:MAG TPA: gliding motility-associated C-terminal domain-containing protein, partial [Puia sp.]|nr:gliding motility-associated C-terminal domain-containing protein [Puia sp.]